MIGGLGDPLEVLLDGPGCVLPTPADDPLALGADNFDRLEFLDAAAPTQLSASGDQKVSGPLRQALWGKQIAGAVDLDGDDRHDLRSSGQPSGDDECRHNAKSAQQGADQTSRDVTVLMYGVG
jgi:hypothetical protein